MLHVKLRPDKDMLVHKVRTNGISLLVIEPRVRQADVPIVLWIHGGGYFVGMKELVFMSRAADLVKKFGVIVVSPGYHLAIQKPYPAALDDCYNALLWAYRHAEEYGASKDKIVVGGESAGGGLAISVCLKARDEGVVPVRYQLPLYPMISNEDTATSRDNHGKVWNTRLNHLGWKLYLRKATQNVISPYAAPAGEKKLEGMPPCYTFVGDGEPFYQETLDYVHRLNTAGIAAGMDVYHTDVHAFDMLYPDRVESRAAIARFEKKFGEILQTMVSPPKDATLRNE